MSLFLGTHQNRLDAKGRVSVPAAYRLSLRAGEPAGLILRPSHQNASIEAWPGAMFHALSAPLERLDLFSAAHDDLAVALYADAYPIEPDKEGRILLPDALVAHARLSDAVTFIGMGRIFQIWEPKAAALFREESIARERERVRARDLSPARLPA
jgi:MraZ protein